MEEKNFVLDAEVCRFLGDNNYPEEKDIPFCQVEVYKSEYRSLESQKEAFDNLENKEIHSYRNSYRNAKTKYLLKYKGLEEHQYQPITKVYFLYLKEKGIPIE